jgi:hypothetical protein
VILRGLLRKVSVYGWYMSSGLHSFFVQLVHVFWTAHFLCAVGTCLLDCTVSVYRWYVSSGLYSFCVPLVRVFWTVQFLTAFCSLNQEMGNLVTV